MSTENTADRLSISRSDVLLHNIRTRRITRYFRQEEPVNKRHCAFKDIPSEALLNQEHQVTLSPSPSQIKDVLSSEDYPLGIVAKRKYYHGHGTIIINRVKTLNDLGLSEKDIQRLEKIFWESKKGLAWSLDLDDEMFSYMKMKAIEKKKKKAGLIVPGGLVFEKSRRKSSIPDVDGRRRSSGYDAEALAKAAARTRRRAVISPPVDDETTRRQSQDVEDAILTPQSSMDLLLQEKTLQSKEQEELIEANKISWYKESDSTQYQPKERRRKKESDSTQYQSRQVARKYSIMERISSESGVADSSKRSTKSDKSRKTTSDKPASEEDSLSSSSGRQTPSVFTDGSVDHEDRSESEIMLSRSKRLEGRRKTDTSTKSKASKSRKKSSSSKKWSTGTQGSDTEFLDRDADPSRKESKTTSGLTHKGSKSDAALGRKGSKTGKTFKSKDRKSKKGKGEQKSGFRITELADRPSLTQAAKNDSTGVDLKKSILESHGLSSPTQEVGKPGLRMYSIARKLHNLWKFSQKTRSSESLPGTGSDVGGPASGKLDKPTAASALRKISGRWDDVNQESTSVIQDFIQKQIKSNSLAPRTEEETSPQIPKYPQRGIYSVFKEMQSSKPDSDVKIHPSPDLVDDVGENLDLKPRLSFKETVKETTKTKARLTADDALVLDDDTMDREDGTFQLGLLKGAVSKLLTLEAQERKQSHEEDAESDEEPSDRDPNLGVTQGMVKDERETRFEKKPKRKEEEYRIRAGPKDREGLLRYYDDTQLLRQKSSSKTLSKASGKPDSLELFRIRQEKQRNESLKEMDEFEEEAPIVSHELEKDVVRKETKQQVEKLYLKSKKGAKGGSTAVSRKRSQESRDISPKITLERIKESKSRKDREGAEKSQIVPVTKIEKLKIVALQSREESEEASDVYLSESNESGEEELERSPTGRERTKERRKESPPIRQKRSRQDATDRRGSVSRQAREESIERLSVSGRDIEDADELSPTSHQRRKEKRDTTSSPKTRVTGDKSPPIVRKKMKESRDKLSPVSQEKKKGKVDRIQTSGTLKEAKDRSLEISSPGSKALKLKSPPISRPVSPGARELTPVSHVEKKMKNQRSLSLSQRSSKDVREESNLISSQSSKERKQKGYVVSQQRRKTSKVKMPSTSHQSSEESMESMSPDSDEEFELAQEKGSSVHKKRRKEVKERSRSISRQISEEEHDSPSMPSKRSRERRKKSQQDVYDAGQISRERSKETKDGRKRSITTSRDRSEIDKEGSPFVSRKRSTDTRTRSPLIPRQKSEEDRVESPFVARKRSTDRRTRSPLNDRQKREEDREGSTFVSLKHFTDRRTRSPLIARKKSEEDREGSPLVLRKKSTDRKQRYTKISQKRSEEDQVEFPSILRKRSTDGLQIIPKIAKKRMEDDLKEIPSTSRKRSTDIMQIGPKITQKRMEEDLEEIPSISHKRSIDSRKSPSFSRQRMVEDQGEIPYISRKRSKDFRRTFDKEEGLVPRRHSKRTSSSRSEIEDSLIEESLVFSEQDLSWERSKWKRKRSKSKEIVDEDEVKEAGLPRRGRRKREDDDSTEVDGKATGTKIRRDKIKTSPERRLPKLGPEKRDKRASQMSSKAASTSREDRFPSLFSDISAKTRARYSDVTLPYIDSQYSFTDDDLSSVEIFSSDHSSSTTTTTTTTSSSSGSHSSKTTSSSSDTDSHGSPKFRLPHVGSSKQFTAKSRQAARKLFLSQLSKAAPLEPIKPPPRITIERPFSGWDAVGKKASSMKPTLNVRLPTLDDTLPAMLKVARQARKSTNIPIMDLDSCDYPQASPRTEAKIYIAKFGITELLQFLLQSLIINEPEKPIDYLIELTRTILQEMATYNRLSDIFLENTGSSFDLMQRK